MVNFVRAWSFALSLDDFLARRISKAVSEGRKGFVDNSVLGAYRISLRCPARSEHFLKGKHNG